MLQAVEHAVIFAGSMWHGCLEKQPKERRYVSIYGGRAAGSQQNIHVALSFGASSSLVAEPSAVPTLNEAVLVMLPLMGPESGLTRSGWPDCLYACGAQSCCKPLSRRWCRSAPASHAEQNLQCGCARGSCTVLAAPSTANWGTGPTMSTTPRTVSALSPRHLLRHFAM